jgi:hypothetical protein
MYIAQNESRDNHKTNQSAHDRIIVALRRSERNGLPEAHTAQREWRACNPPEGEFRYEVNFGTKWLRRGSRLPADGTTRTGGNALFRVISND